MSGISIHLSIKIRILSLKSISFAMSNASCALILLLSLFKDFFAKTLNDVRFDMGGKVFTATYLQPIITQYFIDNKSEIWLLFLIAHSKR